MACARDKGWGDNLDEWMTKINKEITQPYLQTGAGRKKKLFKSKSGRMTETFQ